VYVRKLLTRVPLFITPRRKPRVNALREYNLTRSDKRSDIRVTKRVIYNTVNGLVIPMLRTSWGQR